MTKQEKGLTGLYNLGNTCYMNSILQILSHSHNFKKELLNEVKENNLNNINDTFILKDWVELDKLMWNKNCIIKPNKFLHTLHQISKYKNNDLFDGFEQNDASEFIMFLFDCFHNSCKKSVVMNIKGKPKNHLDKLAIECYKSFIKNHLNDYSVIIKLFHFIQITYNYKIQNDEIISCSYQSNFILNLPINSITNNIYDCFDIYLQDQILDGDNALYNEKTKQKEDVIQKSKFWNLPDIIIICLKRFSYDGRKKENKLINFPIKELDLTKYVNGYNKQSFIYDLYGICNHSGVLNGGHYTSFVKSINDKWYHFNDCSISSINPNKIVTSKAYCLFYSKKY
jgi:ubiquitin carboxyl-terminal hydrolase 8